ncbi:MAG: SpoIIE family protein phosphatase [Acidobacteriota bacterium]
MSARLKTYLVASALAVLILLWWVFVWPPNFLLQLYFFAWLLFSLVVSLRALLRAFLWRVSRRLAFSYFLIGIVPIPLVGALVAVALYILSGSFVGHLYSDSLDSLQSDLQTVAQMELDRLLGQLSSTGYQPVPARFAYYRDNRRFAGDGEAPALFRTFIPRAESADEQPGVPIFADSSGQPALFAAASSGRYSVIARLEGSLEEELRRRMGLWVELAGARASGPQADRLVFTLGGRQFPLEALQPAAPEEEIYAFFERRQRADRPSEAPPGSDASGEEALGPFESPWLVWLELTRPFLDPTTGNPFDEYLTATLVASPGTLVRALLPAAPEVNTFVYLVFATVLLITLNVYLIALIMALAMIFGLSRAVNRLTDATRKVQKGDFTARIEVFRSDQIGALQRSFNEMAGNLESLVEEAAQKEIFERELEIAAQMQQSLLPNTLDAPEPLEFATHFKPSRAIGGDYYDLLPLADGRPAFAIADVAGHGLPAGLRMAMVKSAIEVLCQTHGSLDDILSRLHELLRHRLQRGDERRAFVTATMAAFDLDRARLEIVSAGHPPTYRLRNGRVTSYELPGPPLGLLPPTLPSVTLDLEPDDVFLWLSDGWIEASDARGEAFGYERIEGTLEGLPADPVRVRDEIQRAVAAHAGEGESVDDDLTLIVMAWRGVKA